MRGFHVSCPDVRGEEQSVPGPGNWTLATGGGGGLCEECVYVFTASNVFRSLYITHSLSGLIVLSYCVESGGWL